MGNKVTIKAEIPQTVNYVATSVSIGTTTVLGPNEPATVTNSGTAQNAVLNFGIPSTSADFTNYRTSAAQDAIDITKQPKTLSEPITVNGQIQTTVEDALNAINENSSIANASLSNLNESGENHFANPSFSNITNDGKQVIVNNVMPDFETGVTFNDNTVIQAPYDCVVCWITSAAISNAAYFYISKTGNFSGEEIVFPFYVNPDGYGTQSYYIPKGYYFKTSRNFAAGTGSQYFKLKGAN